MALERLCLLPVNLRSSSFLTPPSCPRQHYSPLLDVSCKWSNKWCFACHWLLKTVYVHECFVYINVCALCALPASHSRTQLHHSNWKAEVGGSGVRRQTEWDLALRNSNIQYKKLCLHYFTIIQNNPSLLYI